jgi:hypothetical protein
MKKEQFFEHFIYFIFLIWCVLFNLFWQFFGENFNKWVLTFETYEKTYIEKIHLFCELYKNSLSI